MKLFSFSTIASAAAAPALVAAKGARSALYVFDPELAGGIGGTIKTTWDGADGSEVTIEADLDFNGVDPSELAAADSTCTGQPKQYLWSIHTQWAELEEGASTSAAFEDCDDDFTGSPYDSKKYGTFEPDENGAVQLKWTETEFASWEDQKPTWNIVIQAICDKASPPVACASGTKTEAKRKYLRAAKRHVAKDDENNANDDSQNVARPDIFYFPTNDNTKGGDGDNHNPHYDPNHGNGQRKHTAQAKRHVAKDDENNANDDSQNVARPDIFYFPTNDNTKGGDGDNHNPHYDPNHGNGQRKHTAQAKRHVAKDDENNANDDSQNVARPDIFYFPTNDNTKGGDGDNRNPHYDPNHGNGQRKHTAQAKRHVAKDDENNANDDSQNVARPDIFYFPTNDNTKGGDGDNHNPHYDPNHGNGQRKHTAQAKRHVAKDDENNANDDSQNVARPDIFYFPTNDNTKGGDGDNHNPHYDPNHGNGQRKHTAQAKRHVAKDDENNANDDSQNVARPDIFYFPTNDNTKGGDGDNHNPHYDPNHGNGQRKHKTQTKSPEMKAVNVKVVVHHKK